VTGKPGVPVSFAHLAAKGVMPLRVSLFRSHVLVSARPSARPRELSAFARAGSGRVGAEGLGFVHSGRHDFEIAAFTGAWLPSSQSHRHRPPRAKGAEGRRLRRLVRLGGRTL
jgi:hypothetical protein